MKPATSPLFKQLEEMTEEELAEQRKRNWSIAKSDTGFWVRADEAPFRYFKDEELDIAIEYLNRHGITKINYIFYQDARIPPKTVVHLVDLPSQDCECEDCDCERDSELSVHPKEEADHVRRGMCLKCVLHGHMQNWERIYGEPITR